MIEIKLKRGVKAQQEMVGFAIIVVLVVIAGLIFLIISAKKPIQEVNSQEISNVLISVMEYTTECAISFVPQYSSIKELMKSCQGGGERCINVNNMGTCEYLNESLRSIFSDIMKTEADVSAYRLTINLRDSSNQTEPVIAPIISGNCTGRVTGAPSIISAGSEGRILVRLDFCYA